MPYAVETRDLTRIFAGKKKRRIRRKRATGEGEDHLGPVTALDQVSIQIRDGELFGMLGPNGAGKTTLIKILATLLLPTSGQAFVAGHDVAKDPFPIRQRINMVSGGETSGYGLLTARDVSPPDTILIRWRIGNGSFATSWPATNAWPDVGRRRVARILISVVLPAPFGPNMPKSSPSRI